MERRYIEQLCATHGKLIHVKKNTILFNEDIIHSNPYIYYLTDGICAISGTSRDGHEQTFLYQMPGQFLGHNPHIMAKDTYSLLFSYRLPHIITKTNCTLYKIPVTKFLYHMEHDLEFANFMIHLFSRNQSMLLAHLKQVQEDPASVMVCRFLLQMQTPGPEGPVVPRLFTYDEISQYIGVHMVTVSRIIGKLKQSGCLKRIPSGLLIRDEDYLRNIILHPDSFQYKN